MQRVLAIPRDGTSIYAPQQHWHLAFAPRIALQLQATRERAASQASAPAAVPAHDAAAPPRPSTRIATVERILARGMRVDALRGVLEVDGIAGKRTLCALEIAFSNQVKNGLGWRGLVEKA